MMRIYSILKWYQDLMTKYFIYVFKGSEIEVSVVCSIVEYDLIGLGLWSVRVSLLYLGTCILSKHFLSSRLYCSLFLYDYSCYSR